MRLSNECSIFPPPNILSRLILKELNIKYTNYLVCTNFKNKMKNRVLSDFYLLQIWQVYPFK